MTSETYEKVLTFRLDNVWYQDMSWEAVPEVSFGKCINFIEKCANSPPPEFWDGRSIIAKEFRDLDTD